MKRSARGQREAAPPTLVPPRNPYEVLGVPPGVTEEQLKATYYRLAAQFHPDRNPGNKEAAERMSEINVAYNSLTNIALRPKLDAVYHTEPKKCSKCKGTKKIKVRKGFGKVYETSCPQCQGGGKC